MNNEQLRQALEDLKAIIDLLEKRQWAKGIRAGAIAGSLPLHAGFYTDEQIDGETAAELDSAADAWIAYMGAGA